MTESTERPLYTILGLIITIGIVLLIFALFFVQRALGAVADAKQAQDLEKLLGGILQVCGDSNHPDVSDLYVTVFGGNRIIYERDISNFDLIGSAKEDSAREAGCNKNCLCAFNGDEAIQCVSMFTQKSTGCQDIDIKEDALITTTRLDFPATNLLGGLPESSCKFRLKLTWDGSSNPNRVIIKSTQEQKLTFTTGSSWDQFWDPMCAFV